MKSRPFYFEIKDLISQFIAAFDDIVIGRFNKNREEKDKINVRYVYAPKQRVLHDLINENKTLTLPAVSISIKSVSRDASRVFNKLDGFYYSGSAGGENERQSKHVKAPVPVNVQVGMSIISRYQTDMDQILSNFIPFSNPYVVISWYVPKKFGLSIDQEIRSEVLWDGNVSLNYPLELNATNKARITADTTFTIKGWLFKDDDNPVGNIFFIDQNFHGEKLITDYESMSEAITESFTVSGLPLIDNIFYNGVRLENDRSISVDDTRTQNFGTVLLNGSSLSSTETVLFSTSYANMSGLPGFTSLSGTSRQEEVSGVPITNFDIVSDTVLTFPLPQLSATGDYTFITYNRAGYSDSDNTLHTSTFSANSTFIKLI